MKTTDPGHISEFYEGYNGTCGECALEVAKAAANGEHSSQADMIAITHDMGNHGLLLEANGDTTLHNLAVEAGRLGLKVLLEWDYAEPFPHDWHSVLLQNAGVHPILLQVAQAHNLHDQETGSADGANVHYHFILVLNKQSDGYVVNDGDNPQVPSRYQVYAYPDLESAVICGLLMLDQGDKPPVSNIPTGWKDDGKVLTAPNGHTVVLGFRDYILGHAWDPANQPLNEAYGVSGGDRQDFIAFALLYTPATNVQAHDYGQEVLALRAEVEALKKQPPIPPSVAPALVACAQLLAPFAAAYAEVQQAQHDLA